MRVIGSEMFRRRRAFGSGFTVLMISLLVMPASNSRAQDDIALFRLTDVSGEFEARYRLNENRNDSIISSTLFDTSTWEEELLIRTQSYIYHPAFLRMSVGGGPIFVQSDFQSDSGRSSDEEILFNFDASFAFLSLRPYPFTMHFRQSHPQTSTGLSGNFVSKTDEYGIRGLIRPTKSRFHLQWDAGHREASGSGAGAILDDETEYASIRTSLPYSDKNQLRLSVRWSDTLSSSGNVGLPIQESRITYTEAEIGADNFFGGDSDVSLRQHLGWTRQDTLLAIETRLDRLNYNGSLSWDASETTDYFAKLRYVDVERTQSWSRSDGLSAGFRRSLRGGFSVAGSGNLSRSEAPGFNTDATGANISLAYRRALSIGTFSATARLGRRATDQESTESTVTIFDEAVFLEGTNTPALSQDFVVPGTVTVTNEAKTQTYVEGLDYRLFVIGGATNIERLVSGNITDGQTVLVSYDFLTAGTVEYDSLTQRVSLSLATLKYATFYIGYSDLDNEISGGSAVTPLNDSTAYEFGARVDYPLSQRWSVGGDYRFSDLDSDITSSVRNQFDVYASVRLLSATKLRLGMQRSRVDNANSPEDTNRTGFTVGVTSRLPGGLLLTYSGRYSEDDGGSIFREELRHGLRLDWGYRRVRFALQADKSAITQGAYEQTYNRVNAHVTRHF
ncbi:MAG: MipA/OmpV family protein [Gammaproteobacteria bacterium]|nr:MipA/OmpV family protein [Gammaproteobacteria bacterium]